MESSQERRCPSCKRTSDVAISQQVEKGSLCGVNRESCTFYKDIFNAFKGSEMNKKLENSFRNKKIGIKDKTVLIFKNIVVSEDRICLRNLANELDAGLYNNDRVRIFFKDIADYKLDIENNYVVLVVKTTDNNIEYNLRRLNQLKLFFKNGTLVESELIYSWIEVLIALNK